MRVCGVGPSGNPSPDLADLKPERGSQRRTLDTDGDALVVRGGTKPERHVVRFP